MRHARSGGGGRRAVLIGAFAAALAAAAGITATAFAAGASFGDTFEDGDTTGWSKSGGTWTVVADGSKVLRQENAGSEIARMFAGDTGWADYTLTARVQPVAMSAPGAAAGIVARATGSSQFERLVLVPGAARIEEVKGSSVTVLSSVPLPGAATGWHTLRLDVAGERVTGFVDDSLVGNVAVKLARGRVGLLTTAASAAFDDVAVTAVAGTPPPSTTSSPTAPAPSAPAARPTSSPAVPVGAGWPAPVSTTTLTATKPVSGSFDGGNVRFVGGGALGGDGQDEGQDPLFELADGATLSNVIIGSPAADGVHCKGSCTLRNVWWQDVGEDAATFQGTSAAQTMTVVGGGARQASDKTFQHNGPGTFVIRDFQAADIGKLYRSCGNCSRQYARHVEITNVTVTVPLKSLVGINPNFGDSARISDVTVVGGTARTVICSLFQGVTSGEPKEISKVPDGRSCVATGIVLK